MPCYDQFGESMLSTHAESARVYDRDETKKGGQEVRPYCMGHIRRLNPLSFELRLIQLRVQPTLREQFIMGSSFHNSPTIHHQN